jgi:hypothetical protein
MSRRANSTSCFGVHNGGFNSAHPFDLVEPHPPLVAIERRAARTSADVCGVERLFQSLFPFFYARELLFGFSELVQHFLDERAE